MNYTILSDCFKGLWQEIKNYTDESAAIKFYAYLKIAYPQASISLQRNGIIVSEKELSELAHHILLG